MARDGSGNYSLPAGQPVSTGTVISSTVFNTLAADLGAALTASLAKDGQTTPTANLSMGGFKHTGIADGTAATHYASLGQAQSRAASTAGSVAGVDTVTASLTPAITSYVAGILVSLVPAGSNTGAATLALNGLTAKNIKKYGATALVAGDMAAATMAHLVYDGVNFLLLNPVHNVPDAEVTYARMQNVSATSRVLGRITAGAGVVEELTAANLSTILGLAASATTDALNASNISSGTLPTGRLSGSYASITGVGTLSVGSIPTTLITGLAASATTDALNASNISSGTLAAARLPTDGTNITSINAAATINSLTIGYRAVPRSTTTTTFAIGDVGKCVAITGAINIPASVFAAGDCISVYNDSAGALNITISAGTLRLAGTTTTGTRALAARGLATLWFNVGGATPEVLCSGSGVS
jgi:hypothetical protein